jgi:DNA-binding SARP family transcriptional activator
MRRWGYRVRRALRRVLGESSGRPIELSGSWRARSLLAWLALHPGSHPRSDVASRFWPDVLDSSARASLRNGLWALRRALGADSEAVIGTRGRVGLQGPPAVWIDAAAFDAHLAAERLEEALALCRGELLAGLDEEWVYGYRDAHRARVSELLERIALREEAAGDVAGAIAWTRQRAALDPLAEDAQRALIVRLTASGDRAGALAAYARLRERLRRELGISASAQTRDLVFKLRESAAASGPTDGVEAHVTPPARGPSGPGWMPGAPFPLPARLRQPAPAAFVGRVLELSALRRLWSHARAGSGARLALVVGEAGIGKSRLVREFALEGHEQGAIVLHGSAAEDLLVPHQHFVEALAHYLAVAAPAELQHRVETRAADLEPIAPGLARHGGVQPRLDGRQESRRYRLFEAVASLLDELATDEPVLLVLDDLHWADDSTAALLRHTFESRPDMRLLVLATQRPSDGAPAGALAEALQRLSQQHFVERLPLLGLPDPDVAQLSQNLTGHELSPELVHAIREEAGGNPFFVQEIVRHLSASERRGGLLSLARADVPEGVREVVNLRLARLDDACVRLLTVAAVVGIEFELTPLEQVSDLQGEDLATALDEALAADLVLEATHEDQERFAFSHALVRRTLLGRLTHAHRRRIHARVAEALEASRGDTALLEIAHHLCEAQPVADREHALDYATRAAEQAIAGLAYTEAVELFTRALSLLPKEDERRRILALKRALSYQALFHAVMDTPRTGTRTTATTAPCSGQSTTSSGVISPTIS